MIHPGERLDHDVVVGEDLRRLVRARLLLQEPDFVHLLLRAVQPDVEAHRPLAVVGRRYRQPVGLEAAVDTRDEAAHDVAGLLRPRRRAVLELDGAPDAGVERRNRLGRVVRRRRTRPGSAGCTRPPSCRCARRRAAADRCSSTRGRRAARSTRRASCESRLSARRSAERLSRPAPAPRQLPRRARTAERFSSERTS